MDFKFKAKNGDGEVIKVRVTASTVTEAKEKLVSKNLVPLELYETIEERKLELNIFKPKVTTKDLLIFTQQFSILVETGVPVLDSLICLKESGANSTLNKAIQEVLIDVERGSSLTQSLAKHPHIFDRAYLSFVEAGEESGDLGIMFKNLSAYLEGKMTIAGKIKSALFYPVFVLIISAIIVAGILIFVIPTFVEIFQSQGKELPGLTLAVLALSANLRDHWYIYLGLILLTFTLIKFLLRDKSIKYRVDYFLLKIPLLKIVLIKADLARFTKTFAFLLNQGIFITKGIEVSAKNVGNTYISKCLIDSLELVTKGQTLSDSFKTTAPFVSPNVLKMVEVGERTGKLGEVLMKVAQFFERELDAVIDSFSKLLEPVMFVILGAIIAVLVLAMYLPIFSMGDLFV